MHVYVGMSRCSTTTLSNIMHHVAILNCRNVGKAKASIVEMMFVYISHQGFDSISRQESITK